MKYESFREAVLTRLSEDIPDPKKISIQKVRRNNGEVLDGLVILENGVNIGPALYLEQYYDTLLGECSFERVYALLLESYENNKTQQHIDVGFFTDFDRIRDHILCKLIHHAKNTGLLKNVPHIPFLDLAIVFYCNFPVDPDIGNATILIDHSHLLLWDKSVDEIYPAAMENTVRTLEPKLKSIGSVLNEIGGIQNYPPIPDPEDPLFPMFVLSNEENIFGAVCMAYDGLIRSLADRFASDLYILPSSVHEVILVPSYENDRMSDYTNMVREVNETQVAPEDILSDHAYYYSRAEDQILY